MMARRSTDVLSLAEAAKKITPTTAVVLALGVLVWFLMTTVTQKLDAHAAETRELIYVLRQICDSTAKSEAAANRCWPQVVK